MGFFSDFVDNTVGSAKSLVSAPAATISSTIDSAVMNPISLLNPMTAGTQLTTRLTGITPTEQYAVGAGVGAGATALWIASPSAYAATSGAIAGGLATTGAVIGGALGSTAVAGGATAAGGTAAGGGGMATLSGIVAGGKGLADSLKPKDEPKVYAPAVATEKKSDLLPMLAIGVGLLSALN